MDNKYYMHRISYERPLSFPLLEEHNILSIGFSDFSATDFVEESTGNREKFDELFQSAWGPMRISNNLYRFLSMNKGDYVVVPAPFAWGSFSVWEIETDRAMAIEELDVSNLKDYNHNPISLDKEGRHLCRKQDDEEHQLDLGFFRKVKPVTSWISRSEYANAALTSRMKYKGTNIDISDIKQAVDEAVAKSKEGKPVNLYSEIIKENREKTHELINEKLNPDKFEKLIQWYFGKVGATKVEIPSKRDTKQGDADIIATFEPIKTIIYVQAKFHKKDTETNEWAIEQIEDYAQEKGSDEDYSANLWVISNAKDFSDEAKRNAKEKGVILINGQEFTEMILKAGISDLTL